MLDIFTIYINILYTIKLQKASVFHLKLLKACDIMNIYKKNYLTKGKKWIFLLNKL